MKTNTVFFSVAVAILLAACGSKKDASNSNFKEAIDAHLAKSCVTVRPGGFMGGDAYPISVTLHVPDNFTSPQQTAERNADSTRPYEVLVKAGLLTTKDGTTKQVSMFGSGPKDVPTRIYDVTDAGKKVLADPNGKGTGLCAARYKVDEVVRFTEPSNAMGSTMSEVSYTFSPIDIADWAKSTDIQQVYTGLASELADHQKGRTMLVLASDGWIDASDFGK
ncbi:hypothetical protein WS97_25550 [Burkholderia territorii]|uniref:hypothetical protein n=1 Tax=Burkholderia territorii TaxID=1503055 RepID=UPI000753F1C8|nr:hypothetical protein [Burkholderia territorii]KVL28714.1 hypothetical protein WS97_25550 [Burkholderia territorii]